MLKSKSFRRFESLLYIFTVMGFVFVNTAHSQFQIKAKYTENLPKTSKASSKIRLDDETQTPHTLVGGYYTTRNGFESKLLMNNKGPQPIEVSPTLYGENGTVIQMPTVTVERNSHITINLRDWANFAGEGFQQGNIRLFHRGKDLVLGTHIQIIDESKSLMFENKLSEFGNFDSRRLEGVWWIPNNDTDSTVVLTNTGDDVLTVTATLTKNPHNSGSAQTFTLLPHQIKVLNVREDFPQGDAFAKAKVLSLSLTHDGAEESLLAWTMVKDESKGYSNIATFTNPTKAKSNQYHGAGLQLGSVGNDELEPIVILRNTTDAKVDVNIKVPYTKQDNTKGTVSFNIVKLNPREVHQVNMQKIANLKNIKTAGIEIEYTGNPGSVVASAQSVSKSSTQVFRTLLWDAPALKSASSLYPFTIEGTSSTKAYIKNAGFKDETYVSRVTWGTDGEYAIPITTIKKGETVEIDVKKLRDEQIPDTRGTTIPLNISKGQINWLLRRGDATLEESLANKVPLVGQALQVDTAKGIHYSYFCLSCCEYGAYSFATLVPSNVQVPHPSNIQYRIFEDGEDCYGNGIYSEDITNQGHDWRSTNTSVATIVGSGSNEGYATTTGGGQTEIRVKINLPIYEFFGYCYGGGGPYFAGTKDSGEICNEGVLPAVVKNTQSVLFSKIAFKKESKRNIALRPDDCDCITFSPTRTLTADLTVEIGVQKIQYQEPDSSTYTDINGTLYVLKGTVVNFKAIPNPINSTFPNGSPVWSGTSGVNGSGEIKSVTFDTESSQTSDFKTVIASNGESTITVNVIVYELIPSLNAEDSFSGRSESRFGLSERIDLGFVVSPNITAQQIGGLVWSVTSGNGTISPGANGGGTYTAPGSSSTETLSLEILNGPSKGSVISETINIIAPNGAVARPTVGTGIGHTNGNCSVGFSLESYLLPTDVSFSQLGFMEGEVAAQATGYYSSQNGTIHPISGPYIIESCNASLGCKADFQDQVSTDDPTTPCTAGDFTWNIPWMYVVGVNVSGAVPFYTATHYMVNIPPDKVSIQKAGLGPYVRAISDPSSPIFP